MRHNSPLWQCTPPEIFPICLGFLGLGVGWRNAAGYLPLADEVGGLLLGFACAYFLFFLAFYLRKFAARPAVVLEDLAKPTARAGMAAAAMSMMLLAVALMPFGPVAAWVWWTGVAMQIWASAVVLHAIWREPPENRHFTPFQYLTFVGPVIGPVAGIPLGYVRESIILTFAALAAYLVITLGYLWQLRRSAPSIALRPSLAIFLAPNCLFALSFGLLGYEVGFLVFYWLSNTVALVLVLAAPWLIKGGFSYTWTSFTFPSAAFVQVQVMAADKGAGLMAVTGIYLGLAFATPLILSIMWRLTLLWVTGELSEQTGAARA